MVNADSTNGSLPHKRASIADVAKLAGVSRSTASYVLNQTPGFKFTEKTRHAVTKAAKELNYVPNASARSLAGGQGPIVFVRPNLPENEVTTAIYGTLTQEFARKGILCTFLHVREDIADTVQLIAGLRPRAAVFLIHPGEGFLSLLSQEGVESVVLGGATTATQGNIIARLQVETALDAGHTTLGFADIEGAGGLMVQPRKEAFLAECEALQIDATLVAPVSRNGTGVVETIRAWKEAGVTAVCAYNDEVALAVLYGISEAGLNCPSDMAVIGCDDIPAASVSYPPLTTIRVDASAQIGWILRTALDALGLETLQNLGDTGATFPDLNEVVQVVTRRSLR